MTSINLRVSAKDLDPNTKYHMPTCSYLLGETKKDEASELFLLQTLQREVKHATKVQRRKWLKICKITLVASVSLLTVANPKLALAAAVVQSANTVVSPDATMLMPEDIIKAGMWLIGMCALGSTILAIVMSQLAGNYRMFRKGKEATEWTVDILKGYAQVILAPVVILLIAFVCYIFFGSFKWFVKPF